MLCGLAMCWRRAGEAAHAEEQVCRGVALLLLSCVLSSGSSPLQVVPCHGLLNVMAVAFKQDMCSL